MGRSSLRLLLLYVAGLGSTAAAPADCLFHLPGNPRVFNLTAFRGVTLTGPIIRNVSAAASVTSSPRASPAAPTLPPSAPLAGGTMDVSICGNITYPCVDSLMHNHITGYVYQYFKGETPTKRYCWDMLSSWGGQYSELPTARPIQAYAHATEVANTAAETNTDTETEAGAVAETAAGARGVALVHVRKGDAHLACKTMTTVVNVMCDTSAPVEPKKADFVQGTQDGCVWTLTVRTAAPGVC